MRTILSAAAALAFVFGQAGTAEAALGGHGGHGGHAGHSRHHSSGHRFSGGYYYSRDHHPHWSGTYYDYWWGQTMYFDPDTEVYYYWHQGHHRYYPRGHRPGRR
jgi:hypothetical protein